MNLLEHYIQEVHSVQDETNNYIQRTGETPKEPLLKVDLTYNCYGCVERENKLFTKSQWETIKKNGYFMA